MLVPLLTIYVSRLMSVFLFGFFLWFWFAIFFIWVCFVLWVFDCGGGGKLIAKHAKKYMWLWYSNAISVTYESWSL